MIYDREINIYTLEGNSPLCRTLRPHSTHYCAEKEVYYRRHIEFMQAGTSIDTMVQLPGKQSITASMMAIPEDGEVYRVIQAQHSKDEDGQDVTILSLHREDTKYDIVRV